MGTEVTSVSPGPAAGVVRGADGATYAPSSFGAANTDFGPSALSAHAAMRSERRRELSYREGFYKCTHHDGKVFDWNGRMTRPGPPSTMPYIGGALPTFYVSLDQRRPSDPYRLAKVIVSRFTALIFGHDRWPTFRCVGDPDTQDFAEALADAARLPALMIRARNIGGSQGTVGLSWRFYQGKPRVLVHGGKNLIPLAWADRDQLVPAHVVELYQTQREEYDPKAKARVKVLYWHRRDWTEEADLAFKEVKVEPGQEPVWEVDEEQTARHGDGFCHFVWVQNLPQDDDGSVDGQCDYEGLFENMLELDQLNSVTSRGTKLNCDPTLVLKMDPGNVGQNVRKGTDNAIVTGDSGDAKYLELAGTSIQTALSVAKVRRAQALEVAECVVPDPDQVAAGAVADVALRTVYAPMLGKGDVLRTQYGDAVVNLVEQMVRSARRHMPNAADDLGQEQPPGDEPEVDEADPLAGAEAEGGEGEPAAEEEPAPESGEQAAYYLDLPPRVVTNEVTDEQGQPTGEFTTEYEPRHPGDGGVLELVWGPYFKRTADDVQKKGTALAAATGGKAVLSQRTGVEQMAADVGVDPQEEWARVAADREAERADQAGMFPGTGGEVASPDQLPDGAQPLDQQQAGEQAPSGPRGPEAAPQIDSKQFASAVEVVVAVAAGEVPRDAGMGLLTLLGLTPAQAQAVLGSAGTQAPTTPNPVGAGGSGAQPVKPPSAPTPPGEETAPAGPRGPGEDAALPPPEAEAGHPHVGPPPPLPDEEPLADDAAEALAAKMTAHRVAKCPHEAKNSCRLCGIERVQDFDEVDEADGTPKWKVVWRSRRKRAASSMP